MISSTLTRPACYWVPAEDDKTVRIFWKEVLERLRENLPVNIIHLDSLLWQTGTLSKPEIVDYFTKLGLRNVDENLAEMLRE